MVRRTYIIYKNRRGWFFVLTAAAIFYMVFLTPPSSSSHIIFFVFLLVIFLATLFSFFLRLRDSLLAAGTIGLLLLLNAYFGPNLLNTVLLISFVLGLRFLVQ